jgi:hypothetical protein
MTADEYAIFFFLVLGLCPPGKQHGTETERSERSLVNMLLEDFVMISNLTAIFALNEPDDQRALARMLACLSILLLGVEALTPKIIAKSMGTKRYDPPQLGRSTRQSCPHTPSTHLTRLCG